MSWSEFLASEFAQTVAFIGSVLSILVFVGMVCRFVYRYIRKSVLPWEAWILFLMLIGTGIALALYSEPRWLSISLSWVIIIMLELQGRIYNRFIKRANENTERTIEQAERVTGRAIEQAERAISLTEKVYDSPGKTGESHGQKGEGETGQDGKPESQATQRSP